MSFSKPLISVVLPVKNGDRRLLDRAIDSIRKQTCRDYEILLVDDGSDPAFAEILDTIADGDEQIRLFHIEPSGVSQARNYAIMQARGRIITFLDSDDAFRSCCFAEAAALLQDDGIDVLWGGTFYIDDDSAKSAALLQEELPLSADQLRLLTVELPPERLHQTRAECIGEPFRFEGGGYINRGIAARFIRKRVFLNGQHQFPSGLRIYEDAIWNLEMMSDTRILYVRRIWYDYYKNNTSALNGFHTDILGRLETPLQRIRSILDTGNSTEYAAYTRLLMDSLRYVYKCLYGNPAWNPRPGEKKQLKTHLYGSTPWDEICTSQFRRGAGKRDRQKALLYRLHLLFFYWKLTWKEM